MSDGATAPEVELSVVVVNWNSRAALLKCLESIRAHPPACAWEVVVVDNASSDGSAALVTESASWAVLIANRTNRGLAVANNQGVLASRGTTIVLSNADVVYPPGALDELRGILARHPKAAFGVPRLRHPDGRLQTSAGDLPSLWEAVLGRQVQRRRARPGAMSGFCWDGWEHDRELQVGRAGDASYVARRAAIAEFGLLDERFPLDWEAIDWSRRARRAGWEIWFSPKAEVTHDAGGSTSRAGAFRWVVSTHRGMYRYFRKRLPSVVAPLLAALFAARAATKVVAIGVGVPMYERARRATRD